MKDSQPTGAPSEGQSDFELPVEGFAGTPEEIEPAKRIKRGNKKACERMIKANLGTY